VTEWRWQSGGNGAAGSTLWFPISARVAFLVLVMIASFAFVLAESVMDESRVLVSD
jgi:hypothetical protein